MDDLPTRASHAFDVLASAPGDGNGPVGLAVSGGSDSVALLHLAHAWAMRSGRRLEVATVDHGLRPEAAAEARQVLTQCDALGVPHATLCWRPGPRTVDQARARRARHALLAEWASRRKIRVLALGHTLDDRIETLLLRIRAGSGWYGLASPLPSAPSPAWPEGSGLRLIRPLMGVSRGDLRGYLVSIGKTWMEDPSNLATRHERVRIRQRMARFEPGVLSSLARTCNGLARLRADALQLARQTFEGAAHWTGDGVRLDRGALWDLPAVPRIRLMDALLLAVGGAATPARRSQLEPLLQDLLDGSIAFRPRTLSHVRIQLAVDCVQLTPEAGRTGFLRANRPGPRAQVERARALLADPRLEALRDAAFCDPGDDIRSIVTTA